jgi:hypothetical protein
MSAKTDAGILEERRINRIYQNIAQQNWDDAAAELDAHNNQWAFAWDSRTPQEKQELYQIHSKAMLAASYLAEHYGNERTASLWGPVFNPSGTAADVQKFANESTRYAQLAQQYSAPNTGNLPGINLQSRQQQAQIPLNLQDNLESLRDAAWYNQTLFGAPVWAWGAGAGLLAVLLLTRD